MTSDEEEDAAAFGASAQLLSYASTDSSHAPDSALAERLTSPEELRYRPGVLLGLGGMGRVVGVYDQRLDRHIAIKVPREDGPAGARLDERLAREAWITARLDHPGIVPILDAGLGPDGRVYFTMPVVRGLPLADPLGRASAREERWRYLRRVLEACEAVACAHRQRVVHCDLKPSNIMLGEGGGTRVLDWGLARLEDEPFDGAVVGTPQYMAPEQARGAPPDARSDVWSLGAILYEVCEGTPLRPRGAAREIVARARNETLPSAALAALEADHPPELVAIVARALAPDPAARYPDAGALAADLAAYLDGRRVTAHAYSARELLWRFVRAWRVPLLVAAGALLVVATLVVIGMDRLSDEAEAATRARTRSEASEASARRAFNAAAEDLARSLVSQALLRTGKGARAEAEVLAAHALAQRESPIARGVLAIWGSAPPATLLSEVPAPTCLTHFLAVRGTRLFCREDDALSAWALGPVSPPRLLWRTAIAARDVAASDRLVAVITSTNDLRVLDPATGATIEEFVAPCETHVLVRESRVVASNNACFWSLDTGEPLGGAAYPCVGHGIMGSVAFDPAEERWAALCEDGTMVRGHIGDPEGAWDILPTPLSATRVALAAVFAGDELIAGSSDGALVRIELATGRVRGEMPTGFTKVVELSLADDGRLVLVRASSGAVGIYEPRLGLVRARLPNLGARAAAFAGRDVLVAADGLRRYRVERGPPGAWDIGSGVTSIALSPDGRWLVATSGYTLEARQLEDGALIARVPIDDGFGKAAMVTAEGDEVIVTRSARAGIPSVSLPRWRAGTFEPLEPLPVELQSRRILALADGSILSLYYKGGIGAFTVDEPADHAPMVMPDGQRYEDLTSTDDGRFAIAVGEVDGTLVRIRSGAHVAEAFGRSPRAHAVAIARDGVVAAAAGEGVIELWDAERGAVTGLITKRDASFTRVAISPDMRWLAAGALDGIVEIWSLDDLRLVATVDIHEERVSALTFTNDSHHLLSGSWDGFVRLLDLRRLDLPGATLAAELEGIWGVDLDRVLSDHTRAPR